MSANINTFTITGMVTRVSEFNGGRVITVVSHQDYKKNDEWVKQSFFLSVTFFREIDVNEKDYVVMTGKITTRENPNKGDVSKSLFSLIGEKIEILALPERKESKTVKSATKPAKNVTFERKSKYSQENPDNTDTDEEEEDELY